MRLLRAAAAAIAGEVGRDEVLLVIGLILLVIGLWPLAGWSSLTAPGGVCVWIALPSRAPMIVRPQSPPAKKGTV